MFYDGDAMIFFKKSMSVLISDITEPFALKGKPVNMLNNIKYFDNINFFQTCDEENGSIFIANIALLNNVISSNVKMTLADLTKYEENMLNHIETVRKQVNLINKEFNKDGLDLEFFIDPKSIKSLFHNRNNISICYFYYETSLIYYCLIFQFYTLYLLIYLNDPK